MSDACHGWGKRTGDKDSLQCHLRERSAAGVGMKRSWGIIIVIQRTGHLKGQETSGGTKPFSRGI